MRDVANHKSSITPHASRLTSPNHHHAGRHAAAHVESQKTFDTLNLVFASGPGELTTGFDHLANASRADRMAITHEAAARVDRQREGRYSSRDLGAHLRQRRRPGLQQLNASTARSEPKNFVSDDLRYGKAVVDFRCLNV